MQIILTPADRTSDLVRYSSAFFLSESCWYRFSFSSSLATHSFNARIFMDDLFYGTLYSNPEHDHELSRVTLYLSAGEHIINLETESDFGSPLTLSIDAVDTPQPSSDFTCSNPHASEECLRLMHYLKSIQGEKILTGQQTSYLPAKELESIHKITGHLPALRGFDLMSCSYATDTLEQTEHCREELRRNPGSVTEAIRWARESHGLVSFCWHWFSPLKGKNKSFYTEDTEFDVRKAVLPGTPEYHAALRDIDAIAGQLKRLADEHIPVLWRPLHEASGGWFWWGARGADAYKSLYLMLYERLTCYHKLNNLIWVWNSPAPGWYPGDNYVDILSTDIYAPSRNYGPLSVDYTHTRSFSPGKPVALGENGPVPDPDILQQTQTPWLWFLTWGGGFADTEDHTSFSHWKKVYESDYTVTLSDLPNLY